VARRPEAASSIIAKFDVRYRQTDLLGVNKTQSALFRDGLLIVATKA
jgi:hypothetical protein